METLTANNIVSVMERICVEFRDHYEGRVEYTEDGHTINDLIVFKFRIGSGIYPKEQISPDEHMNTLIHSVKLNPDLLNDRLFLALQDRINSIKFDNVDLKMYSKRIVMPIAIACGGYIHYLCTIAPSGKLVFKERVNGTSIRIDGLSMRGSNSKELRELRQKQQFGFNFIEYFLLS
jgi:hypothetical protein